MIPKLWARMLKLYSWIFSLKSAPEANKPSCSESFDNPYALQAHPSSCYTRASQGPHLIRFWKIAAFWWTRWRWTFYHQWSLYAQVWEGGTYLFKNRISNLAFFCLEWLVKYTSWTAYTLFVFRRSIKKLVLKNLNGSSLYSSPLNREADDLNSPSEYPQNGLGSDFIDHFVLLLYWMLVSGHWSILTPNIVGAMCG